MTNSSTSTEEPSPVYVPHQEFANGVDRGRFKLIVNPVLAQKYIRHKLFINGICIPMLGLGIAAALLGYMAIGIVMVAIAVIVRFAVKRQAAQILLYLARQDAKIYDEAIEYEVLEVRYAR